MEPAIGELHSGTHIGFLINLRGKPMLSASTAGNNEAENDVLKIRPGKWTLTVVTLLRHDRLRFNELKRESGISQKTLTFTLRELERDGFVSRTMFATIPPRVDYELTQLGRELLEMADNMRLFAARIADRVLAAREQFDNAGGEPVTRLVHPQ
jgi:DNA-binding HxlR family transcriptional regulator